MNGKRSIRILERDNNRRGDLFGRLMADLFVALGYEQPRLNIHRSGRELDLDANHRLEPRRAIAECKATAEPIGGDEVNKFVGALDAERRDKQPVTGYFVSLAGFKETAIEQEKRGRRTQIVTLTGPQAVDELVAGRILIAKERATEIAGRCCAGRSGLVLDPEAELLAHERGWVWAVYYTRGKERTHFALVHADGTPLARVLAEAVIAGDSACGGRLWQLTCLNPAPPPAGADAPVAAALAGYRRYLEDECGYIQLDGMPADGDVGSRRLRLEHLFVPLHLDLAVREGDEERKLERQTVGAVLAEHPRLALLAAPGGGKSTLVRRLAVAYADPARRSQVADDLPARDWFPLFFRCRELRDRARGSFAELVDALAVREHVRQHAAVFRACVDRALLEGRVLLLVDGLDEISDPGDRAAFVCTLRTALQAYPGIAIVVTSREAGFRHVAAHLAPACALATLSPFDDTDIKRLSVAWHREVVGDAEKVRADAEELAAAIVSNDRIKRLAVNPLLLTTLLLVKRWVGRLPTRRAVLYDKAVEVLLMTWNTEGHEPIPIEEALPQLCYVAAAMMLDGVQKVSRPRLAALLREARKAMPTELGYAQGSVEDFIHRVEDRSSLLMMTGHDVEDGRLVEFFEFRHLTFQEFLTATAMVNGWHPNHCDSNTLAGVLEPHFDDEKWREVIPLAAALGGKATEGLIRKLTELVSATKADRGERMVALSLPLLALGTCLADEAAASPETIRAAVKQLIRLGSALDHCDFTPVLMRGRYGTELRGEARAAFLADDGDLVNAGCALLESFWHQSMEGQEAAASAELVGRVVGLMGSTGRAERCEGALGCMRLCFEMARTTRQDDRAACAGLLRRAGETLVPMVHDDRSAEQYAACWAFAWLGECHAWLPPADPDVLGRLFALWQHGTDPEVRRFAGWALAKQPMASRDDGRRCATVPRADLDALCRSCDPAKDSLATLACLVVAWYLRAVPDEAIIARAREMLRHEGTFLPRLGPLAEAGTFRDLLERLGLNPKEELSRARAGRQRRPRARAGS